MERRETREGSREGLLLAWSKTYTRITSRHLLSSQSQQALVEAQKNLRRGSQRPKSLSHPDTSHITSSKAILVTLGLRCFTDKWGKGWTTSVIFKLFPGALQRLHTNSELNFLFKGLSIFKTAFCKKEA